MTQEDLHNLSYAHEDTINMEFLDRWDVHQAYDAGFKKALELVAQAYGGYELYYVKNGDDILANI